MSDPASTLTLAVHSGVDLDTLPFDPETPPAPFPFWGLVVFLAVKVMVVPPLRSRPSFGVHVPLTASKVISPATNTANTISVRPG